MSHKNLVCTCVAIAALMASAFGGTPSKLQRGGDHGGGGGSHGGGGGGSRGGGGQSRPSGGNRGGVQSRPSNNNGGQQVHARREQVRTQNFVPRPTSQPPQGRQVQGGPAQRPAGGGIQNPGQSRQPRVSRAPSAAAQRRFTKTTSGRVYDNGLRLRKGMAVTQAWQRRYFPKGHYHFPFYRPTFVRGQCFVSPFGFYFGICVPFIGSADCHVFPPSVAFIDVPIYNGNDCNGFNDVSDPNYLNDPNLDQDEPGLGNALDELTETYQSGNIDGLVTLIDPSTSIAMYFRGKYKYSIPSNDYVDLTRDAIQGIQTVQFNIQYLHQRAPGVFSVSGQHTYRDETGATQTMWFSFVLQDISGQWTLTQVDNSPGHYHKLVP